MKPGRLTLLVAVFAAMATLAACSSSGTSSGGGGGQPVAITFSPAPPSSVQVAMTTTLTATVSNDPASKGVDWTVGCGTAPCGTLSPAHTASGAATTYTAPSPFATNAAVTITAAATADSTKTAQAAVTITAPTASNTPFWSQWASNPQHSGMVAVAGQGLTHQLANIAYDPFVEQEKAENAPLFGSGTLTTHYQSPLIDGNDVYMISEGGTYTSCNPPGAWAQPPFPACGPNAWQTKTWGEARYTWESGTLEPIWTYVSDWKPPFSGFGLFGWEPVFHPIDANGFVYVPGFGGTLWKINKADGSVASQISPVFGGTIDPPDTFVASPLTADASGNIYYNVIQLVNPALLGDPWAFNDVVNAWLVKVTATDTATLVTYATLTPNAPPGTSTNCAGTFFNLGDGGASLPWPPATPPTPPAQLCGSQRPGMNLAPAVAPDGTIYTASRAHFDSMVSYLIAVNPDLTLKWASSLQNLLHDGCGVIVPIAPAGNPLQPNSCSVGATVGVDPTTNAPGSGNIADQASSTPTVLPDGSVVFGTTINYNAGRGELLKFDASGNFLGNFDFGWDSTPAVYQHNGTYSLIIKDNHYPGAFYCGFPNIPACQSSTPPVYYISQINTNMQIEWSFQSTNTNSCTRNPDGTITCVSDHPNGFEWCVNAPVVDLNGVVYANSEDGNLYTIPQGNSGVFSTPLATFFTQLALGAAYTPLSIGPDGKIYTENDGQMFVVGN